MNRLLIVVLKQEGDCFEPYMNLYVILNLKFFTWTITKSTRELFSYNFIVHVHCSCSLFMFILHDSSELF